MKRPNPEHAARICELVAGAPYPGLLSMRLTEIGAGYARAELDVEKKHLQPFDIAHGGVLASLIDTVAFWAVYFGVADPEAGLTSIDLKLNFLAPVTGGRLIAEGRQIQVGWTIGYGEARVSTEEGRLIAHGTSTLMILRGRGLETDPPLPPKFLDDGK